MELTWNSQVIQRHTIEARINSLFLIPLSKSISDMLRVGAEVTIQLIMKAQLWGRRKCWQFVKDIFEWG